MHPGSSSSCSGWRKQDNNVVSGGGRGGCSNGGPICYCGMKSGCTCRTWMMTGIPCCHSLAAMKFLNIDGERFIDSYYFKSRYEETYSTIIYPINGAKMWNITPYPDVYPPHKRVLPGRPKRKQKLEQWEMRKDESRMTKSGLRKRCRICRQHGHNRTRCPSVTQPGTAPGISATQVGTGTSATQATTPTQQSEIAHES